MSIHTVADDGTNQAFTFSPQQQGTSEEIDVTGAGRFALAIHNPVYLMGVSVKLAPGTHATGEFHLESKNYLSVFGDASTSLTVNVTSDLKAANTIIQPAVLGTAQIIVEPDGELEFKSSVADTISVGLNNGLLKIDDLSSFHASVNSTYGELVLDGIGQATSYDFSNGILSFYQPSGQQIASLRFNDQTPSSTGVIARVVNGEVQVTEKIALNGADPSTLGGAVLSQHVVPAPTPQPAPQPASHNLAVHDVTTGTDLPDTSAAYTGPVAGITSQFVNITPDNLNITAMADNLFIKTGTGNDAVALHGGTNVVDAGGGSPTS